MDISDPRVPPSVVPEGSRPLRIAEHQQEYETLPSIVTPMEQVITRWTPTDEERAAIVRGEDIYVTICGLPIRPMFVTIGIVDWKAMEDNIRNMRA